MTSLTNDDLANELRLALLRVERLAQELRDRGRGDTVDAAMKAAFAGEPAFMHGMLTRALRDVQFCTDAMKAAGQHEALMRAMGDAGVHAICYGDPPAGTLGVAAGVVVDADGNIVKGQSE